MRFTISKILISVLLTACSTPDGPFKNGVYESVGASYRHGFFLEIKGQNASLYGWDLFMEKDTIYYKAFGRITTATHIGFTDYEFFKVPFKKTNIQSFETIEEAGLWQVLCYSSFSISSKPNSHMTMHGVKTAYDSRFDTFEFKLVD